MKTNIKIMAAAAFLFVSGIVAPVHAAIVTATESVTFEFDMSGLGTTTFTGFGYTCYIEPTCIIGGNGLLSPGASFTMGFGTTAGAADIGTVTFANPSIFPLNNVGANLSPNQVIAAGVNSLFVTFGYVDDEFGIDTAALYNPSVTVDGTLVSVSAVPLPAGMLLLVGALGGLGAVSRRAKKRLA